MTTLQARLPGSSFSAARLVRHATSPTGVELQQLTAEVVAGRAALLDMMAAGWRTLRQVAEIDARLDGGRLEELRERAGQQAARLEALRVAAAAGVFQGRP